MPKIETISQIDTEDCDMVVCSCNSCFEDDVQTTCHFCGTPIVHRPHMPLLPKKVCIKCALSKIAETEEDVQFVVSEKTKEEVEKKIKETYGET